MEKLGPIKTIHKRELDMHSSTIKCFYSWVEFLLQSDVPFEDNIHDTVFVMGSMSDATFTVRTLVEDELTLEGDVLFLIADVPAEAAVAVEGKCGFYHVRRRPGIDYKDHLIGIGKYFSADPRYPRVVSRMLNTGFNKKGCLTGKSLKELATFFVDHHVGLEPERFMEKITSDILVSVMKLLDLQRMDLTRGLEMTPTPTEINGPAITVDQYVKFGGQHLITGSLDMVASFRLSFWPPEAEPWIHRKRKWPSPEVVQEIVNDHEVYLVAKPSSHVNDQLSTEFRLTFLAERRLKAEQTEGMKFTYYLCKMLFYKYFKAKVDGKTLPSYLAKSLMFWLCEEIQPSGWSDANIETNLKILLGRLFDGLEKKEIPNYFVPEINLLGNVSDALIAKALEVDKATLLADPLRCLPEVTQKVKDRIEFLEKIVHLWPKQFEQPQSAQPVVDIDDLD